MGMGGVGFGWPFRYYSLHVLLLRAAPGESLSRKACLELHAPSLLCCTAALHIDHAGQWRWVAMPAFSAEALVSVCIFDEYRKSGILARESMDQTELCDRVLLIVSSSFMHVWNGIAHTVTLFPFTGSQKLPVAGGRCQFRVLLWNHAMPCAAAARHGMWCRPFPIDSPLPRIQGLEFGEHGVRCNNKRQHKM
jgi:hypothetical protein